MLAILVLFTFFFTNDFGLIDVEKTSIITAIAIDYEKDKYIVTAQIAVPEATDTNTENQKAQLSGVGFTVGEALKDLGDVSGWFPKLAFCNLILLGKGVTNDNVIKVVDYFAKTLRVQDSAQVALSDQTASELLSKATPLDNISAFAIQKIMLKNTGFDRDVAECDVKTFCAGYYSISKTSFMPLIKVLPASTDQKEKQVKTDANGGQSEKTQGKNLFDARSTALFLGGRLVGTLNKNLTLVFNAVNEKLNGTTIPVNDVDGVDYLLAVQTSKRKVNVKIIDNELTLNVNLELFVKIADLTSPNSEHCLSQNSKIPKKVLFTAQEKLSNDIEALLAISKQSGCDLFKIKEKLYRFNRKEYSRYKDNCLDLVKLKTNVKVVGYN